MKKVIFIMSLLLTTVVFGQTKKEETITIKTDMQCSMCENIIKEALIYTKGIKQVETNLEKDLVVVVYKPKKTNPDAIRNVISKAGYDADSIPAVISEYEKLPACCKKPE
jgi:mercuric ion binding protein